MNKSAQILRDAVAAVNLHADAISDPRELLLSLGFDLRQPESAAWWHRHYPRDLARDANPVPSVAWLDGFLVALCASGQLPTPLDWAAVHRAAVERAADLVELLVCTDVLPDHTCRQIRDEGVRTASDHWLAGFREGVGRRQELTRRRWTGRH